MRLQKTVALPCGQVTVLELRVCDVRALVHAGEGITATILETCLLLPAPVQRKGLNDEDAAAIWAEFEAVNQVFFKAQRGHPSPRALDDLDRACVSLIERGHANVMDYGWRFFSTALEAAKASGA